MPSFEYEPLVMFLELETSNEEEDKGDIDGVGPQVQKWQISQETLEEERIVLRGRLLNRL